MSKKKKLNREIRLRLEKEKLIKQYPEDCFCDDPEYDENNPIGETDKTYYSIYDYDRKNPFSLPIYKCNKCGKNIVMVVVQS